MRMSRTVNGVVAADDEHKTENDKYIETQPGESGTQQLVTLSVICQDVEANNMDYFISIHSNAAPEGSRTNYPLILYRGTDSESGNGLTNARDMARAAWPYVNKNEVTYKSYYTGENDNNHPESHNERLPEHRVKLFGYCLGIKSGKLSSCGQIEVMKHPSGNGCVEHH